MLKRIKAPSTSRVFVNKCSWECIGGRTIYFRSKFEVRVAWYLESLIQARKIGNWDHEPKTFWFEEIKRGVRSYLPDFKITRLDGTHCWIEVKGYMDAKSKTKLKRFKKYYPNEELFLFGLEKFSNQFSFLEIEKKITGLGYEK